MSNLPRRADLDVSQLPQADLLRRLDIANQALNEARTLPDLKDVRDRIAAIEGYMRQRDASVAAINEATRIKSRAEHRLGEMLKKTPKAKGAAQKRDSGLLSRSQPPKLKDMGISLTQSSRWQRVADVPLKVIEQKIDQATEKGEEISATEALKRARKESRPETPPAPPLPIELFSLIYADPPWQTDFERGDTRDVEKHYPTMPLEAIKALPVSKQAAKDCVLFLWATSPMLPQALAVLAAWGFVYKTSAVWAKSGHGMGYYFRQDHELLLVGTKGSPGVPAPADRPSSVVSAEKGRHSEKPAAFYELIERMYPQAKRLELFARQGERDGWTFWGNEVGAKADLPADGLPQRGVGTGSGGVEADCSGVGTGGERGSAGGDREENLALCFG